MSTILNDCISYAFLSLFLLYSILPPIHLNSAPNHFILMSSYELLDPLFSSEVLFEQLKKNKCWMHRSNFMVELELGLYKSIILFVLYDGGV